MTFNEIVQTIRDREAGCGCWLTLGQAKETAAREILEGFRNFDGSVDLEDARAWLETFRDREAMLWTLYGYEIDANALEAAIRYREQEDSNA